jgi:hypothetical protein
MNAARTAQFFFLNLIKITFDKYQIIAAGIAKT